MSWKNGRLKQGIRTMDYVQFGQGSEHLIMIPGLGDGVRSVAGTGALLAWKYREFGEAFQVTVISRSEPLLPRATTRDMAQEVAQAMTALKIDKAHVLGVSQGGMIAQWLAADHPEKVTKLVLAVTSAYANPVVKANIGAWLGWLEDNKQGTFIQDVTEKNYSPVYLKKLTPLYPFLDALHPIKNPGRLKIQSQAILSHDARPVLEKITCPTFILGGQRDLIVGPEASRELHETIVNSRLYLYEELGHGLHEEAEDFPPRVLAFLGETI